MSTILLDLSGLKCPLPALKTRKALISVAPGAKLEVHCTDPLAVIDIPNLIRETGDKIEIRPMMYLALSYDHRLVDGREAVTFLVRIKDNLEDPQRLLLDL